MAEPLDEAYLKWLYSQVAGPRIKNPSRTYWRLFRQLYKTEFVWIVPNDDNRVEDGKELRPEFMRARARDADQEWLDLGCSFLEMLIALSRRVSFEHGYDTAEHWFWVLLKNVGLDKCNDASNISEQKISEIVNRVIYRTYDGKGNGGLFPHKHTSKDQRKVELWYQFNGYLLDDGD